MPITCLVMSGSTNWNVHINIQFEVNIRSRNFAHRTLKIIEIKVKHLHLQHTVLKTHTFCDIYFTCSMMCQSVKSTCGNWWQHNWNVTLFSTLFSWMHIDLSALLIYGRKNLADYCVKWEQYFIILFWAKFEWMRNCLSLWYKNVVRGDELVDRKIVMFMQEILLSRKCIAGATYMLITGKMCYKISLASETDESS